MDKKALKAWLEAIRIDDVRRRIERLETMLADPLVFERIEECRDPAGDSPAKPAGEWPPGD